MKGKSEKLAKERQVPYLLLVNFLWSLAPRLFVSNSTISPVSAISTNCSSVMLFSCKFTAVVDISLIRQFVSETQSDTKS